MTRASARPTPAQHDHPAEALPTGRLRGDSGLVATELAVVMPLVMFLILVVFQAALYWHAKSAADFAAQQAVSATSIASATETNGYTAIDTVLSQTGNLSSVTRSVHRDGGRVTVDIDGVSPNLTPFGTWRVQAHAEGDVERFVPRGERQ